MTYSRGLKWLLALLLPASLLWKLTVRPDDSQELRQAAVNFLLRQNFTMQESADDALTIRGQADKCRVFVRLTAQPRADWEMVRSAAAPDDKIFIVFRGRLYSEPPDQLLLTDYVWTRVLRELGLVRHLTPVLAVVASPDCHAEQLPWTELETPGAG